MDYLIKTIVCIRINKPNTRLLDSYNSQYVYTKMVYFIIYFNDNLKEIGAFKSLLNKVENE